MEEMEEKKKKEKKASSFCMVGLKIRENSF